MFAKKTICLSRRWKLLTRLSILISTFTSVLYSSIVLREVVTGNIETILLKQPIVDYVCVKLWTCAQSIRTLLHFVPPCSIFCFFFHFTTTTTPSRTPVVGRRPAAINSPQKPYYLIRLPTVISTGSRPFMRLLPPVSILLFFCFFCILLLSFRFLALMTARAQFRSSTWKRNGALPFFYFLPIFLKLIAASDSSPTFFSLSIS